MKKSKNPSVIGPLPTTTATPRRLQAIVAAALVAGSVATWAAEPVKIMAEEKIDRVSIDQVQMNDGTVRGMVRNTGDERVEDLTLRVTYQWHWQDEFNPGSDGPGFSTTMHFDSPLAPGEQREFTYTPDGALPSRQDGHFSPEVSVVSFTAYDTQVSDPQASN